MLRRHGNISAWLSIPRSLFPGHRSAPSMVSDLLHRWITTRPRGRERIRPALSSCWVMSRPAAWRPSPAFCRSASKVGRYRFRYSNHGRHSSVCRCRGRGTARPGGAGERRAGVCFGRQPPGGGGTRHRRVVVRGRVRSEGIPQEPAGCGDDDRWWTGIVPRGQYRLGQPRGRDTPGSSSSGPTAGNWWLPPTRAGSRRGTTSTTSSPTGRRQWPVPACATTFSQNAPRVAGDHRRRELTSR